MLSLPLRAVLKREAVEGTHEAEPGLRAGRTLPDLEVGPEGRGSADQVKGSVWEGWMLVVRL